MYFVLSKILTAAKVYYKLDISNIFAGKKLDFNILFMMIYVIFCLLGIIIRSCHLIEIFPAAVFWN